jgi:UDP-N-acetylmuramyl tripeptide synthase
MLIAGIFGSKGKLQTAAIINSMLASQGEKVSVVDSARFPAMDGSKVKAYIAELEKNSVDLLLLKIELADIDRLLSDDVQFDILIYTDKAEDELDFEMKEYTDKVKRIFSLMADKGVAIVNVDDNELIRLLQGMRHRFITYGFNTKASVTTSSIGDSVFKDGFICCLQRSIPARNGQIIEPQEYKLQLESGEFDSHNVLAAASFAIINGIDLNNMDGNHLI